MIGGGHGVAGPSQHEFASPLCICRHFWCVQIQNTNRRSEASGTTSNAACTAYVGANTALRPRRREFALLLRSLRRTGALAAARICFANVGEREPEKVPVGARTAREHEHGRGWRGSRRGTPGHHEPPGSASMASRLRRISARHARPPRTPRRRAPRPTSIDGAMDCGQHCRTDMILGRLLRLLCEL